MLSGHFTTCAEITERKKKEREKRLGGGEERDHLTPDYTPAQLQ